MADFKPSLPYTTAIELLIPTSTTKKGVLLKTFPKNGIRLNCSFNTYGGTERIENDVFSVVDTAVVETWYRPDIAADCRIRLLDTGEEFEIIGKPENINRRNQFCKFKVKAVESGA